MDNINLGDAVEFIRDNAARGMRDIFVPRSIDDRARREATAAASERAVAEQKRLQDRVDREELSLANLKSLAVAAKRSGDTRRLQAAVRAIKAGSGRVAKMKAEQEKIRLRSAPIQRSAELNDRMQAAVTIAATVGNRAQMERQLAKADGIFNNLDESLDVSKDIDDLASQFDERFRLDSREASAEARRKRKEKLTQDLEDEKEEIEDEEEEREMIEEAAAERRRLGLPEKRHAPGSFEAIMEEIEAEANMESMSALEFPPAGAPVRRPREEARPYAVYEGGGGEGAGRYDDYFYGPSSPYPPGYGPPPPHHYHQHHGGGGHRRDPRDPRDPPPDGGSPSCAVPVVRARGANRPVPNPFYAPQNAAANAS